MGQIQSNIGILSNFPIGDTVDALMKIAARPRDMLAARTTSLKEEQVAVTGLTALLEAFHYITGSLGKSDLYHELRVTSSDPNVLVATLSGQSATGTYQFTPLRMVRSQQFLGSGVASRTDPLGGGKLTFRFGDTVQRTMALEDFNGGEGIARGKIRITDRSGERADIDLSTAQTLDDVLAAINDNTAVNVTAVIVDDRIRLIDGTGQTVSNLRVQEVGGGTTAASLGLAGIDVAAATADGEDRLRLYDGLTLDALNDGRGVRIQSALADIAFSLRGGTTGQIDFSPIASGSSGASVDATLGDVLERINAAAPGKLRAEIGPDGERLVVTDLTTGGGAFTLAPAFESGALEDLGLGDRVSVDGVITGQRILGAAQSVLLSSLNGGQGYGTLGAVQLTDRTGATDTVDLSGAETLDEVVTLLSASAVGIRAEINSARNGIRLVDTTDAQTGNLVVASADATGTAEKLGIAVNAAVTAKNSGDMHLQVVAENTRLEDLNGGSGVAKATMTIFDSRGAHSTLDLSRSDLVTVGDVIREINRLGVDVRAEINETGDGIRIVDTAGGSGTLRIEEGYGTAAADLHLLGGAKEVEIDGNTAQVIDGSTTYVVAMDADDSLQDLRQKINDIDGGLAATILTDGSSRPYRLSLVSGRSGKAGQLVVDVSDMPFSLEETVRGQDALLAFGDASRMASTVLVSSSNNRFSSVVPGVKLEIKEASGTPVTVVVGATDTNLLANAKTLVDNYNKFRKQLSDYTAYDAGTNKRSILTGDATALRLDTDLGRLISGRFAGVGPIQSLAEVGILLKDDGTLSLDESKLKTRFADDPAAVEQFFTAENVGVSAKFDKLIEGLSGIEDSLLTHRRSALDDTITDNEKQMELLDARLESQRQSMLLEFYRMEIAISKMQNSLSAIQGIQPMDPVTSVRGVSS